MYKYNDWMKDSAEGRNVFVCFIFMFRTDDACKCDLN